MIPRALEVWWDHYNEKFLRKKPRKIDPILSEEIENFIQQEISDLRNEAVKDISQLIKVCNFTFNQLQFRTAPEEQITREKDHFKHLKQKYPNWL